MRSRFGLFYLYYATWIFLKTADAVGELWMADVAVGRLLGGAGRCFWVLGFYPLKATLVREWTMAWLSKGLTQETDEVFFQAYEF